MIVRIQKASTYASTYSNNTSRGVRPAPAHISTKQRAISDTASARLTIMTSAAIRTPVSNIECTRPIATISSPPILRHHISDRINHVLDIVYGHPGIEGQRNNSIVEVLSPFEIPALISELLAIVRMEMDGNEMDTGSDIPCSHFLNKPTSVDRESLERQSNHVQMPRVPSTGMQLRRLYFK